jgi:hypothetical protein
MEDDEAYFYFSLWEGLSSGKRPQGDTKILFLCIPEVTSQISRLPNLKWKRVKVALNASNIHPH